MTGAAEASLIEDEVADAIAIEVAGVDKGAVAVAGGSARLYATGGQGLDPIYEGRGIGGGGLLGERAGDAHGDSQN